MFRNIVIVGVSFLVVSGCAYLPKQKYVQSRDNAYLEAGSIPPLHMPKNVRMEGMHDNYPVPATGEGGNKAPSLIPPGF